ncbi:MAG: shikimate dehydrogenase [Chloroflexota bacterium]|nr:shikimate dehydrogenase [Chloroflexota bacterium]
MSISNKHLLQSKQAPFATGTAMRVGLIGNPATRSSHALLHQAAFDALGLPAHYELWYTPSAKLVERVRALCEKDFLGANVTLPYKQTVMPLLDRIDEIAARVGAVNTIVQHDDYLYGYNTDAVGLLHALVEHGVGRQDGEQVSLEGYSVILLGAGAVARCAAFALASACVERLIILDRHLERAQNLARDVQQYYDGPVFSLNDASFVIPHSSSIIINATTLGMHGDISPLPPEVLTRFDSDTFVYDMIYNPTQTLLLCQARIMGLRSANGLSMLLHQAAQAFTLWTGQPAPLDSMRTALL